MLTYSSNFIPGHSDSLGSPGTCVNCSQPVGNVYTSNACGVFNNTVISPLPVCPPDNYLANSFIGTAKAMGSPGICTPCPPGKHTYAAYAKQCSK
jgi:hypothetical protein